MLGQIPEALYFALFLIFAKKLKEKRLLFIILMVIEYILLKQLLHFTIWFQILYTFITFLLLKVLYKNKAQITDIFIFTIASIILILISAIPSLIFCHNITAAIITSRMIMFSLLFLCRNKLYSITNVYKSFWNRENKVKKIKTTTFRAINIVIFNLLFYIINLGMLYTLIFRK